MLLLVVGSFAGLVSQSSGPAQSSRKLLPNDDDELEEDPPPLLEDDEEPPPLPPEDDEDDDEPPPLLEDEEDEELLPLPEDEEDEEEPLPPLEDEEDEEPPSLLLLDDEEENPPFLPESLELLDDDDKPKVFPQAPSSEEELELPLLEDSGVFPLSHTASSLAVLASGVELVLGTLLTHSGLLEAEPVSCESQTTEELGWFSEAIVEEDVKLVVSLEVATVSKGVQTGSAASLVSVLLTVGDPV